MDNNRHITVVQRGTNLPRFSISSHYIKIYIFIRIGTRGSPSAAPTSCRTALKRAPGCESPLAPSQHSYCHQINLHALAGQQTPLSIVRAPPFQRLCEYLSTLHNVGSPFTALCYFGIVLNMDSRFSQKSTTCRIIKPSPWLRQVQRGTSPRFMPLTLVSNHHIGATLLLSWTVGSVLRALNIHASLACS